VEEGYPGSSKDHYYRSMGATEEASRLMRRERACGCRPCLCLHDNCTMTPANLQLQSARTARATTVKLQSSCPAPEARHTRNARNPLPEFCEGLSIGDNIIVRVSKEEKADNPDEEYFVAKIEDKAVKLEEAGTYSAVKFKKMIGLFLCDGMNLSLRRKTDEAIGSIRRDLPNGSLADQLFVH